MIRILTTASFLFSISLSLSAIATAAELPLIPDPKAAPLPIQQEQKLYPCDQIVKALTAYNQMARQHDQSITAFLGEVTQKVTDWYATLSPLEKTTQTLPEGTFLPLQDGAQKISSITDLAFDNSNLLAIEMDRILGSLRECNLLNK